LSAYLDVLLRANPRAFLEAWTMANDTATFEEVFTEAGIIPQWIERGIERNREEIARKALAKGLPLDTIEEITGLDQDTIRQFTAQ
jgi:predicted transposase YdaD